MLEFQKSALQGALSEPLCAEYKQEWRKCGDDKLKLLKLAMKQQAQPFVATYCYKNKGLTKEYIKNAFDGLINGFTVQDADGVKGYSYGLYVDYSGLVNLSIDVCSMMWCKDTDVAIETAKCPTLYVSNCSKVNLVCDGFNSVRVYLFDESEIVLEDIDSESSVIIYRYSKDAKINVGNFCMSTKVSLFDKQLRI